MYLSRLILNPHSRAVRRDLADCQDLHRTVMSGFADAPRSVGTARADMGVLYRVDINGSTGRVLLYVQSREAPDWSKLAADYLQPASGAQNPAVRSIAEAYATIREGMVLRFRLRANPTVKADTKTGPDGQRRNGRRVPLHKEEDLLRWLERKGSAGGFQLLAVRSDARVPEVQVGVESDVKSRRASGHHRNGALTFGATVFEGHLRVENPDAFRLALARGIGSAKAYGFGLLSVAREGG